MKPLPPEDITHVVENVPWDKLYGKRILMTGGTGFFGRWMVESFLASDVDAHLTILTRKLHTNRDSRIDYQMSYSTCVMTILQSFDLIVHMANETLDPFPTNILGTRTLLDLPHKRFLFTSSGAVYDADSMNPADAYGICKRMAENLCVTHSKAPIIARCFSFAGPGMSEDSALLQIIRGAMKGRIELNSDGSAMRTYMYASDLAIRLWNLAISGETFKAHDVGGWQVRSIKNLAETVASYFSPRPEVIIGTRVNPVRNWYVPDPRTEGIGFDEAIEKTVRWYREE